MAAGQYRVFEKAVVPAAGGTTIKFLTHLWIPPGSDRALTYQRPGSASLRSLKRTLIYIDAADISTEQTNALAEQISAKRLQLKRLRADQQALGAEIERRALSR